MAPHMHYGVLTISAQGRIQGRAKIGRGGPHLINLVFQPRRLQQQTECIAMILKHMGCWFWFHSEVKFFTRLLYSGDMGERHWPFGPLVWLIRKARWPPWPIRQKSGTLYSGAQYVAFGPLVLAQQVKNQLSLCDTLSSSGHQSVRLSVCP